MIQTTDPSHKGRYDAVRCGTCGRLWSEHTAECSRHAYRPGAEPEPGPIELLLTAWGSLLVEHRNGTAETARANHG